MSAPYVQRLTEQIDLAQAGPQRAVLIAELGCYLARVGRFAEAESIRSDLRRDFGDGKDVGVSILIMCLEGLIAYFKDLDPNAYDRIARALLLSVAASNRPLVALTSAWLAHMHFNKNNFKAMADSIRVCVDSITSSDFAAACRLSLVLGDAFTYSADTLLAKTWYARARDFALTIGDQASIGALTYNKAALSIFALRVRDASAPVADEVVRFAEGEVRTAINYQFVADLRSLDHLLVSAKIGSMLLQHRYGDARLAIERELSELHYSSMQRTLLQADLAVSLVNCGDNSAAIPLVESITDEGLGQLPIDDQILARTSVHRACQELGFEAVAKLHSERTAQLLATHAVHLADLKSLLSPFARIPESLR